MPPVITIEPTTSVPERILSFGASSSGKSVGLLSVARRQPDKQFHVVDNDDTYERLLVTEFTDVLETGNVHVYPCSSDDWEAQLKAAQTACTMVQAGDWYGFDMITETWEAVQSWFTQKVFAADLADYFIDVRVNLEDQRQRWREEKERNPNTRMREPNSLSPFEGFLDWAVINPQYKKLYRTITDATEKRAHVYVTAESKLLRENDRVENETRAVFEAAGVQPKGQKRLPHLFHTTILFEKAVKRDEWKITTCGKDRGRTIVRDLVIPEGSDFAKTYLMGIAGWKVRRL